MNIHNSILSTDKEYINYLINLRNDFYNRDEIEKAKWVQQELNELLNK
jgi:hypothetical protein